MTQHRSRKSTSVVFLAGLTLVALVLTSALFLSGDVAVSEAQGGKIPLDRGKQADAERLTGLADHLQRTESECEDPSLMQGRQAYAARLNAQAARYLDSSVVRTPVLNQGRIADATRLTGMAMRLGVGPEVASSALACSAGW